MQVSLYCNEFCLFTKWNNVIVIKTQYRSSISFSKFLSDLQVFYLTISLRAIT